MFPVLIQDKPLMWGILPEVFIGGDHAIEEAQCIFKQCSHCNVMSLYI